MIDDAEFLKMRKIIAKIMYNQEVFKHICDEYDSSDHAETIAHAVVAVLQRLQKEIGVENTIDLELMFAAGLIVFTELNNDIKATGREPLDEEAQTATVRSIVIRYLAENKGKYDPEELKKYLSQLQKQSQDGTLEKMQDKYSAPKEKSDTPKDSGGLLSKATTPPINKNIAMKV